MNRMKILTCLMLCSFFIAQPSYAGCKSDCEEQYQSARDDCNSQYDSPDDAEALQSCITHRLELVHGAFCHLLDAGHELIPGRHSKPQLLLNCDRIEDSAMWDFHGTL